MSQSRHDFRYPSESAAYRAKRDQLLEAEIDLRRQVEEVAALRRSLPPGGELPEDYVFEESVGGVVRETRFSDLFEGEKDTLLLYSYMFGGNVDPPCVMCTSFIDNLDRSARHLGEIVNVAVVAKVDAARLARWAESRGWEHLRLVSSAKNSYNADYYGENADGAQQPMLNVFKRSGGAIHHRYGSEMLLAKLDGQPRHIDLVWPIWNLLDLTPDGRGEDWYPKLAYD